ncbi:hypothetical protein [Streptomyces hirsutus]|uniref:hypothetical protein n=1 Tax=Streptomyces hirsutus TaxID=35620 RepID=UPI00339F058C
MTAAQPLRPDLARELIALADQSAARWSQQARNELDAVHLGRGRHADHANAKRLSRILAEENWPGHRLVDPGACRTAYQIALHTDEHDFQRLAPRLLHPAIQVGSVEALAVAVARQRHEASLQSLVAEELTRAGAAPLDRPPPP